MAMLLGRSFDSWCSLAWSEIPYCSYGAYIFIPANFTTVPLAVNVNVRASFVQGKRHLALDCDHICMPLDLDDHAEWMAGALALGTRLDGDSTLFGHTSTFQTAACPLARATTSGGSNTQSNSSSQ